MEIIKISSETNVLLETYRENCPIDDDRYFIISKQVYNELQTILAAVNSVPENEWREWSNEDKMRWSNISNSADVLIRNCTFSK